MGFVGFVVWNGGHVVVGDKDNHQFALHPAMLVFPMGIYVGLMGFRMMLAALQVLRGKEEEAEKWVKGLWTNEGTWLCVLVLAAHLFYRGCLSHPFLLSDNRFVVLLRLLVVVTR